jgi:hypothetical protein
MYHMIDEYFYAKCSGCPRCRRGELTFHLDHCDGFGWVPWGTFWIDIRRKTLGLPPRPLCP